MSPTISEIAEAFSRHEFDRTYPPMDDDIEWAIVAAENCVVMDRRAGYVDAEGESSRVASCDIYDFLDGSLAAITTYAVKIDSGAAD